VTEWDPPNAVAFTWHPGRGEDEATSVKVAFGPVEGGTAEGGLALLEVVVAGRRSQPGSAWMHGRRGSPALVDR
jgi:hypothetical protein